MSYKDKYLEAIQALDRYPLSEDELWDKNLRKQISLWMHVLFTNMSAARALFEVMCEEWEFDNPNKSSLYIKDMPKRTKMGWASIAAHSIEMQRLTYAMQRVAFVLNQIHREIPASVSAFISQYA